MTLYPAGRPAFFNCSSCDSLATITVVRLGQSLNASASILVLEPVIVTVVSEEHPLNAHAFISVTFSGITISVNDLQLSKVL